MEKVTISSACIQCEKCIKVCPAHLFSKYSEGPKIQVNPSECIDCGHCVAFCPVNAIQHKEFPAEKIHPLQKLDYPTPEQMMTLIKGRRSNRAFSEEAVPEELLHQIVEAAYRAPTASNLQQLEFTLITNSDKLRQIATFTVDVFFSLINKLDNPIGRFIAKKFIPNGLKYIATFKKMKVAFDKGEDHVLRGAKAVLLIHTPKNSAFGRDDANLAYQNASLMAEVLGVSQFYTGFVLSATQRSKGKLEKILGIKGEIKAGMALSMPLFHPHSYIDRKDLVLHS